MRRTLSTLLVLIFIATGANAGSCATDAKACRRDTKESPSPRIADSLTYAARQDAMQFADEVAQRHELDPAWVRSIIGSARFIPSVQRLILPPAKSTMSSWNAYRSRTVDVTRIAAGAAFWRNNAETLARAQATYGVPPEIIVGIIGVETIYGRNMGNFRVLDALATLTFDFPEEHPRAAQRTAFFREELENFLSLESRTHEDPRVPRGSYAGAMGMPQFMPSSIAKYAVDFDGDDHIDLVHSAADVIGSVANYLHAFGWQAGVPATFPVDFNTERLQMDTLLAPDIVPTFSVDAFCAAGVILDEKAQNYPDLLALIKLRNGQDAPSYVAGTQNFYVITRYNWSSYYAMAVLELGAEIKAAMGL